MRNILFFILVSIFSPLLAFVLEPKEHPMSLTNYAKILIDKNSSYSPQSIIKAPSKDFLDASTKIKEPYLTTIWFKVELENNSSQTQNWSIYNSVPGTDYLDYYIFDGDKLLKHVIGGDRRDFRSRETLSQYSSVKFFIEPNQKIILIAKYANQGRMQPSFFIQQTSEFVIDNAAEILIWVLMFGFLIAMAVYNLIVFLSTKNRAHFYYFMHIASILTGFTIIFGFLNIIFPAEWLEAANKADRLFSCVGYMSFLLFFATFLQTKNNFPKIHRIVVLLLATYGILLTITIYLMAASKPIFFLLDQALRGLFPLLGATILLCSLYAMYKKQKYAGWVAIAWMGYASTGVIVAALLMESIEHAYWIGPSILFAFIIEVIFLTYALGLRTRDTDNELKESIVQKLRLEVERQKDKETLIQNEKMAQLGNMLGAIIHQWKQPLNAIGLEAQYIKMNNPDKKETVSGVSFIMEQISFMSKTADEFRDFYKPSKKAQIFNIRHQIESVISLLSRQFKDSYIVTTIDGESDISAKGYPEEFKHVILNIIGNSKDAFENMNIDGKKVSILIQRIDNNAVIFISDNAGGIDNSLLPDKLFWSFVSTKGEKGTGVGLSLCKTIIEERMGGSISASNKNAGAEFVISLPLATNPK